MKSTVPKVSSQVSPDVYPQWESHKKWRQLALPVSPGRWIRLLEVTETLGTESDRINMSMSYFQGECISTRQKNRVEGAN